MNSKLIQRLFFLCSIISFFYACVPANKLQDEEAARRRAEEESSNCREKLQQALQDAENKSKLLSEAEKSIKELVEDTATLSSQYSRMKAMNKDLDALYDKVIAQNKDLLNTSTIENQKLSIELENKEEELEKEAEKLKALEASLKKKESDIDALNKSLSSREAKVKELEDVLKKKDEATLALKKKINDALLGFEGDLTVKQKNGKVYVSISEKLLFQSGRTEVDPKGKEALEKVAQVLKKNDDINVLIEGHTDSIPMTPNARIKDNWDLSVLRATSIVKILTDYGVDPKKVSASGRGEFFPVADNADKDGRAKNRRTEIILTPKLDELLQILGSN